jgi:hypothetical protein
VLPAQSIKVLNMMKLQGYLEITCNHAHTAHLPRADCGVLLAESIKGLEMVMLHGNRCSVATLLHILFYFRSCCALYAPNVVQSIKVLDMVELYGRATTHTNHLDFSHVCSCSLWLCCCSPSRC